MKKLVSLACIAIAVVVVMNGCDKSNPYSGNYVGTMSSVQNTYQKDNVPMQFTNGIKDKTNLYLFLLPLTKVTTEKYEAKGDLVIQIIKMVKPDVKADSIQNAAFQFTFSTGKVTMYATYNVLGVADLNVITYEGVKQ